MVKADGGPPRRLTTEPSEDIVPAWSRDGRTLYFVRRTPGPLLSLRDSLGNAIASQTYTTAIWQARADGSGPLHGRGR